MSSSSSPIGGTGRGRANFNTRRVGRAARRRGDPSLTSCCTAMASPYGALLYACSRLLKPQQVAGWVRHALHAAAAASLFADAAESVDVFWRDPGQQRHAGLQRPVQSAQLGEHRRTQLSAAQFQIDTDRLTDEVLLGHAQEVRPVGDELIDRAIDLQWSGATRSHGLALAGDR